MDSSAAPAAEPKGSAQSSQTDHAADLIGRGTLNQVDKLFCHELSRQLAAELFGTPVQKVT